MCRCIVLHLQLLQWIASRIWHSSKSPRSPVSEISLLWWRRIAVSSQGSHLRLLEVVLRNMRERERERKRKRASSVLRRCTKHVFCLKRGKSPGWSGHFMPNYSEKAWWKILSALLFRWTVSPAEMIILHHLVHKKPEYSLILHCCTLIQLH